MNKLPIQMMYITNNVKIARIAEANTVDIIFVDLETIGKNTRQSNMNSVKSNHSVNDVNRIKESISYAKLLVRINPLHENTQKEIDEVISRGADIIMLPMFYSVSDVEKFIFMVNGRAKVMLLVETREAEKNLSAICNIKEIYGIHIGLNDLHIAYGYDFLFEILSNGNVDNMCKILSNSKISYGFGGIAQLNQGLIPGKKILMEHYRLGSNRVILSRSFCNTEIITSLEDIQKCFSIGMNEIRQFEYQLSSMTDEYFNNNKNEIIEQTRLIVENIKRKKNVFNNQTNF